MATIKEDYVSFEIAKLLKEKGFDEKCQKVYMYNGQLLWAQIFMEGESFVDNKCIELVANYNNWITYTQGEYAYLCPTLQMAMKWLREVHNIHIIVNPYTDIEGQHWSFIFDTYAYGCWQELGVYITDSWDSYEKAVEAAIKYCLKNLI